MGIVADNNLYREPRAPIRVLVAAAYPMARAGLAALLGGVGDIEVVGQTAGDETLPATVAARDPNVLLLDQPGDDTNDQLTAILAQRPALGALIVGTEMTEEAIAAALDAGARGYLLRESSSAELIAAVRAVAAGLLVLDPTAAADLLERRLVRPQTPVATAPGETLTPRELEVLQALAGGLTNRAIARRLSVSENTVKFHVSAILTKLSAASRAEAVALAARRGLLLL